MCEGIWTDAMPTHKHTYTYTHADLPILLQVIDDAALVSLCFVLRLHGVVHPDADLYVCVCVCVFVFVYK